MTSIVNTSLSVPPALVALKVTGNVPAVEGVPLINPVEVSTVSGAGKPVASKLVGEFVAVI